MVLIAIDKTGTDNISQDKNKKHARPPMPAFNGLNSILIAQNLKSFALNFTTIYLLFMFSRVGVCNSNVQPVYPVYRHLWSSQKNIVRPCLLGPRFFFSPNGVFAVSAGRRFSVNADSSRSSMPSSRSACNLQVLLAYFSKHSGKFNFGV